jgi:RNA-directed DNA polymerase
VRKIYVPSRQLSFIQNRIRHGLLLQIPVEDCVHGFVRGRGIVTNAQAHARRRCLWIMNLDLKDFFPGINFARVVGLFRSLFNLSSGTAAHLARLTTYDNHLCQGFCTSPDLANFVAWKLDRRLMGLANKQGIVYTRYADDLTFSSENRKPRPPVIRDIVRSIVEDEGFRLNEEKAAIMSVGRRQLVTGLVVSEHGINIPRRIRRLLRSAIHHWPQQTEERRASIRGWVSYLHAIDPLLATRLLAAIDEDETRTWTRGVSTRPFSHDISSRGRG